MMKKHMGGILFDLCIWSTLFSLLAKIFKDPKGSSE